MKHVAEREEALMLSCSMGLVALILTLLIGRFLERRQIHKLPASGVGMLLGTAFAGAVRLLSTSTASRVDDDVLDDERFNYDFFMVALLPPIIFEAGFNMQIPAFLHNIWPTLFFAFVGTGFSTLVVGGVCYAAGQLGLCYPLGLLASFVFGSLVSATDPVSVLSVFQAIGVNEDVFAMVFGEAVLNDAVAIVLTRTLLSFSGADEADATTDYLARIVRAFGIFCLDFVSSLLMGAGFGATCALVLRRLEIRSSVADDDVFIAVALCFAFAWAGYYVAEAMQLSGVVTLLFCGIVCAIYAKPHMSDEAQAYAGRFFKIAAVIAETYVFIYLGEAVFTFPILHHTVWRLVGVALLACALGRSHVLAGVWLTNLYRRKTHSAAAMRRGHAPQPISTGAAVVLWWSGLRGGVAFALASASFGLGEFKHNCGGGTGRGGAYTHTHGGKARPDHCSEGHMMTDGLAILQTTLLIGTFTIFVLGGTIKDVAMRCGVLSEGRYPAPGGGSSCSGGSFELTGARQ